MEFRDNKAIYLQIAEFICERILLKQWAVGDKIPSVRELAVQLEVNPNTVARTVEFLQQKDIIFTKRGMGYFVSDEAVEKVMAFKKDDFLQNDLPLFFKNIQLLGIDFEELKGRLDEFKKSNI
jgi:GntR family transcriptional regulator